MRDFNSLFTELSRARSRYEDLRRNGASLAERLDARVELTELRAAIGAVRRNYAGLV